MVQPAKQILKENKHHGDKSFPLAVYTLEQQGGDIPIVECHWHKEIEFFYCLEGEVLFQINQEFIHVRAGEAVFIDSEEIHTGHSVEQSKCKFAAIVLDTKLLDSAQLDKIQTHFISPLHEQRRTFPRHITKKIAWQKQLLDYIQAIVHVYMHRQIGFELVIKANLLLMLQLIYAEGATVNRTALKEMANAQSDKLKKIISYIFANYDKTISLNELAQLIPMSEGHFCRFFKKMTRQTVTEYINSYRIRQAATLLRETDKKVSTIAYEVGFEHISYFIKLFKLHFNCSPTAYRRQKL